MRFARLAIALLTATLIASTASALPKQGDVEVGGMVGPIYFDEGVDDPLGLTLYGLLYYTDAVAVGARVEAGFADDDFLAAVAEARMNFIIDPVFMPYAGIMAGPAFTKVEGESDPGLTASIFGGVKSYLTETVSVFLETQYGFVTAEETYNSVAVQVGLSMRL